MAERVRVRELDDEEGNRLLRIIRRGSGSVVTWRRAQMVLLSAQGMIIGPEVVRLEKQENPSARLLADERFVFRRGGPRQKQGRAATIALRLDHDPRLSCSS